MIERCLDPKWKGLILNYIGDKYLYVPYFYSNLDKYGVESEHVSVWADVENGAIVGAYLLYYDCLHFFTRESDYPAEKVLDMIATVNAKVFFALSDIGTELEPHLCSQYLIERNYTIDITKMANDDIRTKVETAEIKDLDEIVDLMLSDPEYQSIYSRSILYAQMHARLSDHFGRLFVIRKDGKIVVTYSIYAETDNMAVLGGLLVHPQYRRQGLALDIVCHTCSILTKEKKRCIGFINYNNTPSLELHKKNGAVILSSLYKFVTHAAE